jgi:hypothetical protein
VNVELSKESFAAERQRALDYLECRERLCRYLLQTKV